MGRARHFAIALMALLGLGWPASALSAVDVRFEATSASGCTDARSVRRGLESLEPSAKRFELRIGLRLVGPNRFRLNARIVEQPSRAMGSTRTQAATRTLVVRREDCPLVPRLLARILGRFMSDLATPRLGVRAKDVSQPLWLRPRWPKRLRVWLDLAGSPGFGAGARPGVRLGLGYGPAGRVSWGLALGYDTVPPQPVPPGRGWLHGVWLGVGATHDARWGNIPIAASLFGVGGVVVAVGKGFHEDRTEVLPLVRGRFELKLFAAEGPIEGLRPHLGLAVDASPVQLRLLGPNASGYTEPRIRGELLIGLSWSQTLLGGPLF